MLDGMSDDGAPKSAYELAMERLRKKDKDAGVEERSLSSEQKAEMADLRRVFEAKLAELEILHRSNLRKPQTEEELTKLEAGYRRDRERLEREREEKIDRLRRS